MTFSKDSVSAEKVPWFRWSAESSYCEMAKTYVVCSLKNFTTLQPVMRSGRATLQRLHAPAERCHYVGHCRQWIQVSIGVASHCSVVNFIRLALS